MLSPHWSFRFSLFYSELPWCIKEEHVYCIYWATAQFREIAELTDDMRICNIPLLRKDRHQYYQIFQSKRFLNLAIIYQQWICPTPQLAIGKLNNEL